MMLRSLVFWDEHGGIVGSLDHLTVYDDAGAVGVVDFDAHEMNGGRLREIAEVSNAVGAGTWPEWLGAEAHQFTVELSDQPPGMARAHISALVHKKSGHRRVRADIEAAIEERINEKKQKAHKDGDELRNDLRKRGVPEEMVALVEDPEPEPADLRDIVGGPNRPLLLDDRGRTRPRPAKTQRPALPVVRRAQGHPR